LRIRATLTLPYHQSYTNLRSKLPSRDDTTSSPVSVALVIGSGLAPELAFYRKDANLLLK
jgi:hypothetical protein